MTPANLQEYLNKLVKNQLQISTMIWGAPGIGKSSIVAQVAQENNLDFIDLQQPDECKPILSMPDLLNQPLSDSDNEENNQQEMIDRSDNIDVELTGSIQQHKQAELKAYWQNAMQQANIVARTTNQGKLPAGMERQFKELQSAQIDWRTYLWRYLVQTPTDFQGFDR